MSIGSPLIFAEKTIAMMTPRLLLAQSSGAVDARHTVDGYDFAEDDSSFHQLDSREATGSTHEIKFFVLILGARTPPPRIEAPVMKIPL
jgi:hypothetical protein